MIVGTAGHIDHGKTALVRALTGVDTDRLKEEKARGITIELGFAYLPVADERIIGFVDVPGHERFVHTMLAGAGGIDFALLVVAADDGIMPQTREHLAILDMLGLRRGVVALTKADLADDARRAAVAADIRGALASTGLKDALVLPVSTVTREGLSELKDALVAAERETPAGDPAGRFRLAVDRCFTLAGAGTVMTGTVLGGTVAVGDRVVLSPSGLAARVRSIHAQNRPVERGIAGQRCALNLAGEAIHKDAIGRGDVVLDPELHAPTSRLGALLRLLPGEKPVGSDLLARFHHESAEAGARLVPLDGAIAPGASGFVQVILDRPIAAVAGDHFVLRDPSARRTIGGGVLLDLRAPARKRRTPERLAQLAALAQPDPAQVLEGLLATAPYIVDLTVFARDRGLDPAQLSALRERLRLVPIETGRTTLALSPEARARFSEALRDALLRHHIEEPDRQGIGREQLRLRVQPRLPREAFLLALQAEAQAGEAVLEGAFVRRPEHMARANPADDALWSRVAPLLGGQARFRPPRVRDLASLLNVDESGLRRTLKLCARLGRVDQVAHDHFFLRETTREMVGLAREVAEATPDGTVVAAAFRDRMDGGRKVAIQILDFFDRHGITIRRGDLRRINPHRLDVFGPLPIEGREPSPVGRPDFKSGWGSEPVPGGFDPRSLPPSAS